MAPHPPQHLPHSNPETQAPSRAVGERAQRQPRHQARRRDAPAATTSAAKTSTRNSSTRVPRERRIEQVKAALSSGPLGTGHSPRRSITTSAARDLAHDLRTQGIIETHRDGQGQTTGSPFARFAIACLIERDREDHPRRAARRQAAPRRAAPRRALPGSAAQQRRQPPEPRQSRLSFNRGERLGPRGGDRDHHEVAQEFEVPRTNEA